MLRLRGRAPPTQNLRMSDKAKTALEAWEEADKKARAAERVVFGAWQRAMDGKGPAPTHEELAVVAQLRSTANDKLTVTIAALKGQV